MKLGLLIILVSFRYGIMQDVKVPHDLLKPSTTTTEKQVSDNDLEDTTVSVELPVDISTTTKFDDFEVTTQVPPIYDSKIIEPEREEILECPIDFIRSDTKCIPLHSNKCPLGYIWKEDRCVLSQTVCPLNFDFNGTICIERQVCPPNHIWKDGKCEAPDPQCQDGWKWNGYKCEVIDIQCEAGFVLKGKKCVLEKFACPDGFELINDQCINPLPICPPNYELQESGFCRLINIKCPAGTEHVDGMCKKTIIKCETGYEIIGDNCYKVIQLPTTPLPPTTTETHLPITKTTDSTITGTPPVKKVCPDDFVFYNGQCYRCPVGYHLCNGLCLRNSKSCNSFSQASIPAQTINIHLNFPVLNILKNSSSLSDDKPVNIEPINNNISNINNVTHPVILNNFNENNIYVYTDTLCADGKVRTTIVKNNQTVMGCDDSENVLSEITTSDPESREEILNEKDEAKQNKCCEIVTPRRCKKRSTNQWMCTHRRYKHCGEICIADRLYVKPPATVWSNQVLTISPNPVQTYIKPCFGQDCPSVDCSGCIDGSYNCSPQCFTYPCTGNGCTYVNQDRFCEEVNDKEFCDR